MTHQNSKTPPTEPGYYWATWFDRWERGWKSDRRIIQVVIKSWGVDYYVAGDERGEDAENYTDWTGPILDPYPLEGPTG
jgi:hypothetical protein